MTDTNLKLFLCHQRCIDGICRAGSGADRPQFASLSLDGSSDIIISSGLSLHDLAR